MNIAKLRRNLYERVRFRPSAISVQPDETMAQYDDVWILTGVASDGMVELSNQETGHVAKLGTDHIHHFDSDPPSSTPSLRHGFLTLTVQIYLQGARLWLEPVGLRASAA